MPKTIEGKLTAKGYKFAICASRFNDFVVQRLIDGAMDALIRHEARQEDITLIRVPGSFELPAVAKRVVDAQLADAVICLGAVIRGETPHFDYISAEVTKGLANLSISSSVPIAMGVITADTVEQAIDRAGAKAGNKGFDAAMTAIELVNLYNSLPKK